MPDFQFEGGLSPNDVFNINLDTQARLNDVLNVRNGFGAPNPTFAQYNPDNDPMNKQTQLDPRQAIFSNDPTIKDTADKALFSSVDQSERVKGDAGFEVKTPYDQASKYLSETMPFSPARDNEDFYYQNKYLQDGLLKRSAKNVGVFFGRILPDAAIKLGQGLGYAGSMISSIGSSNYWADVADNAMSKYLDSKEQDLKNSPLLSVYHGVDYNSKGFFSKLLDGTMWTDEIADSVAFMASAYGPSALIGGAGKIGAAAGDVNAFAREFSTATKLGRLASNVGMGSYAELSSWTLNTAMEAAQEGAGVFKDSKANLERLRAKGDPKYKDMSDDDIRHLAGTMAGNTVLANFGVLGLSNAYENTLFFKRNPGLGNTDVLVNDALQGESKALNLLDKGKGSLSRVGYYGKEALKGFAAEGLWEENAQLAIQRMNTQGDETDDTAHGRGFIDQYLKQITDAISGHDTEAAESIGLGALIGIGAGVGFSALHGERKELIHETKEIINHVNTARQNLFNTNDIYKLDEKGNIEFDKGQPVVDETKLQVKKDAISASYSNLKLATLDDYRNSEEVQYRSHQALADYVRSMNNIGFKGIGDRFSNMSPERASIFGLDPGNINENAGKFRGLAEGFERISNDVNDIKLKKPSNISDEEFAAYKSATKDQLYSLASSNHILDQFISNHESKILQGLNNARTLTNASLSQFPVEQLNTLIYKKQLTQQQIDSPGFEKMAPVLQDYYKKRLSDLSDQVEQYKTDNESVLEGVKQKDDFFFSEDKQGKSLKYPPDVFNSQKKIAQYENVKDVNQFNYDLLADPDKWHSNIDKMNAPELEAVKEAVANAAKVQEKSPFKGFKEHTKGDFSKLIRLAGRIVGGEQIESKEDIQLAANYPEIMDTLVPQYGTALEASRKKLYQKKLDNLTKKRDDLLNALSEKQFDIAYQEEDVDNILKGNKVITKKLQNVIYKAQKAIDVIESEIKDDEKTLAGYNSDIARLQEEIQYGTTQNLQDLLVNTQKEASWLTNEIAQNTSLLKRLKSLLRSITDIAYQLFHPDKAVGKQKFIDNLIKGRHEAVEAQNEITANKEQQEKLKKDITDYTKTLGDLQVKVKAYDALLTDIKNTTNAELDKLWKDLTDNSPKPAAEDATEKKLTESFEDGFNTPPSRNVSEPEPNPQDDYIRPLATKFFTSTFPFVSATEPEATYKTLAEVPPHIINHMELMTLLNDNIRAAEVKAKIGAGKLKVLVVTKDNMKKYGLDHLYAGNEKYWDDTNTATQRMDYIHVIEDNTGMHFIDKGLNKIGKVGEKVKADKVVGTILRATQFSAREIKNGAYLADYGQAKMDTAIEAGINFREDLNKRIKAGQDIAFEFNISRGIMNRQVNEDKSHVHNSVIGILLNKDQIKHDSVIIPDLKGDLNYNLNGTTVQLPKGRAFIKTRTADNSVVLHPADITKLGEEKATLLQTMFSKISEAYIKNVEDVMKKELNGRKLSEVPVAERTTIMVNFNKKKGLEKFNKDYIKFIKSIAYFGTLKKISTEHPETGEVSTRDIKNKNQIYLKGSFIYFGNTKVDITDPAGFNSPEIKAYLADKYHNVSFYTNLKDSDKTYTEYYLDKGKLKDREWSTYSHYLLSDTLPDGSKRSIIPITTQIKSREFQKNEAGDLPFMPYISQAVTPKVTFVEGVGKKVTEQAPQEEEEITGLTGEVTLSSLGNTPAPQDEEVEDTLAPEPLSANKSRFAAKRAEMASKPVVTESTEPLSPMKQRLKKIKEEQAAKEAIEDNTNPPAPTDLDIDDNGVFRISKGGIFEKVEDLNAFVEYAAKVIPQFPVVRLKNAIKVTPTIEAFGQFTGDVIKLWEGAEEGTGYHEVFEAVANKILSNYEWKSILGEFTGRKGTFTDRESGDTLKFSEASEHQAKEAIAEEFRHYKLTGELPSRKNTRTFFKVILDFIKSFFNNRSTIDSLFKAIDQGKLANATNSRSTNRFKSAYSIDPLPTSARDYNDFIQGFTAFMFHEIFNSPESLTMLNKHGELDSVIYDRVRDRVDKAYADMQDQANLKWKTNTPDKGLNAENEIRHKQFQKTKDKWEKVKGKWGQFVNNHKDNLRKFSIKFDDEYNLSTEDAEQQNRNDYTESPMKVAAKNAASPSVKFLIGTLLKVQTTGIDFSTEKMFPKLSSSPSSIKLKQLENYDNMMKFVLKSLHGLNRIDLVEQKMRDVSGMTAMLGKSTEEQEAIAASISPEQSAMGLLYVRLFGNSVNKDAYYDLQTRFLSYVSKQKPTAYIGMFTGGDGKIIKSTDRPAYEKVEKNIRSSMRRNIKDIFTPKKNKQYITKLGKGESQSAGDFEKGAKNKDGKNFGQIVKFLGLDKIITPEYLVNAKQDNPELYETLTSTLGKIRGAMTLKDDGTPFNFTGAIDFKNLNIYGYINDIIRTLDQIKPLSDEGLQYNSGSNEKVQIYVSPSFVSKVNSEINNSTNLDDLIKKFPNLGTTFAQDSILLQKMFKDGQRTDFKVDLGYIEGLKENNKYKKTSQLEYHSRLGLEFLMSLSGFHYTIPADSETEWIFNTGDFVKFKTDMLKDQKWINEMMIPKLRSEMQLVQEADNFLHVDQLQQKYNKTDTRTIGESLRFFKDILSPKTVEAIYEKLKTQNPETILDMKGDFIKQVRKDINDYFNKKTEDTFDKLVKNRIVNENEGVFVIDNLTSDLRKQLGASLFSEAQVKNVVAYAVMNSHIASMEQFKLFYGDPAQYKQFEKRVKSLFSPVEMMFIDESGEHNNYLNENRNKVVSAEEMIDLPENDMFRREFKDYALSRTIEDFTTVNPELVNMMLALKEKYKHIGNYEETNEADGQSVGTLSFIRELMIKSGSRWTSDFEYFYQYDNALARNELSKSGKYTYTSDALKAIDEKILEGDIPLKGPTPIKTLGPSVRPDGTQDLLKHSVYPISYQLAKEFDLLDTYLDMMNRGDDMINFKSAHKVGVPLDNEGDVTHYYQKYPVTKNGKQLVDKDGNLVFSNSPFEKTDLVAKGNPQFQVSYRTFGIQVETQNSGRQTLGSQLTKDIYLNLFENSIPTDFREENPDMPENEMINTWNSLPEEERMKSKNYALAQNSLQALQDLKDKSMFDTTQRLGVKFEVDPDGNVKYYPGDLEKLKKFVEDELTRLEVDSNIMQSMQLNSDKTAFLNPAETLTNYDIISNVIYALADKSINSIKVNGHPMVQVSSAFFTKGRKGAYKEGDKWITVNNKEEYQKAVEAGHKVSLTSSDLKFYSYKEGDKKVTGMEVYLPHIYRQDVNDRRKAKGLPALTDQQLMDHLNANPKLLEGIGFRIPTQATSSLEFFKIKGFLPEAFGSAVVVPSDITTKAGSDFDVDKLSTYMNNWKLGKDGLPFYEEFKDYSNSDQVDRYLTYVNSQPLEFAKVSEDHSLALEYLDKNERIKYNKEQVEVAKDLFKYADQDSNMIYGNGLELFSRLVIPIKQQFYDKERELRADDISGIQKILEYKEYVKNWIDNFKGSDIVQLSYKDKNNNEHTVDVDAKQSIGIFNLMMKNYDNNIEAIGLTKELEQEYYSLRKEKGKNNRFLSKEFNFKLAQVAAKANSLASFESFSNLPIHLQNTRGAVENKYFESIRDILSQPERLEQLLSINSMDNIKDNAKAVLEARGLSSKDKTINHTNFLDMNYMSQKRHDFITNKYNLGIAAVAMTNYANAQMTGLGVVDGTVKAKDKWIMNLQNGDISLPFASIHVHNINGYDFIPISKIKGSDDKYVMDKISGYINGFVDVAKDPFIVDMGTHKEIVGSYLMMERMGASGRETALFLYQPAIREYLKELIYLKNPEFGYSSFPTQRNMIDSLLAKYNPENLKFQQHYFTNSEMEGMIRKGEDGTKLSKDENYKQWVALVNFLKLNNIYSQNLLENILGSNHDTAKIRSNFTIMKKDFSAERARKGNVIMSPQGDGFRDGVDTIRQGTAVQKTIDLFKSYNGIFSGINLFALQRANPSAILEQIARDHYTDNPYQSDDDFHNFMKENQASMVDTLMNKWAMSDKGVTLQDYIKQFFKPSEIITQPDGSGIQTSPNNLFNQFTYLGSDEFKAKYPYVFRDNFFFENLDITKDDKLGVYTMDLKVNPQNSDSLSRNLLIQGIRDLVNSDIPEVAQFGRAVEIGAIIQFGVKPKRNSITQFIPMEDYTTMSNRALAHIDTEDFSIFPEEVIRSNASSKGFTTAVEPKAMTFIKPGGKSDTIWASINKEEKKAGRKLPKMSEKRFLTKLTDTQIAYRIIDQDHIPYTDENLQSVVDHINSAPEYRDRIKAIKDNTTYINLPIFQWIKYEDEMDVAMEHTNIMDDAPQYMAIEMVRPEYVRKVVSDDGRTNMVLNKQALEMMERNDFSWSYIQLYKVVGKDNGVQIVKTEKTTKGPNAGKTNVYLAYKPINGEGADNFNSMAKLDVDDQGNVTGSKSQLDIHPEISELTDNQVNDIVNSSTDKGIKKVVSKRSEEYQQPRQTAPKKVFAPKQVVTPITTTEENAQKLASGRTTGMLRVEKIAQKDAIPVGETQVRSISRDKYNITNRGLMTIEEAGGLQAIFQKMDITPEDVSKYSTLQDWIKGNNKLFVYDVSKVNSINPSSLPSIDEVPCD